MPQSLPSLGRRMMLVSASAALATRNVRADQPAHPGLALGRPHTDFVQSQITPSRVLTETGSQPGVDGATVSYDAKGTRAVTVIMHYPVAWKMLPPHYVNSDQEFLVLDGSVIFNGIVYTTGDYAYFPAGHHHDLIESPNGGTVLNFYEGEHKAVYERAPPRMLRAEKLIKKISTLTMLWSDGTTVEKRIWGRSARRKLLRTDSSTGESTWILSVGPEDQNAQRPLAVYQAVEEMFVLEGEVTTPHGVMHSGSYAWRNPGTHLGPYGTKDGFTALFRSKGGALKTTLSKEMQPVNWDATYNPLVIEAQKSWVFASFNPDRRY
jgi:hypothetical protein